MCNVSDFPHSHDTVSIKRLIIPGAGVECSSLHSPLTVSDKEVHGLEGMGRVVISGSVGGVMVSALAWNARDVGSIPALGVIWIAAKY